MGTRGIGTATSASYLFSGNVIPVLVVQRIECVYSRLFQLVLTTSTGITGVIPVLVVQRIGCVYSRFFQLGLSSDPHVSHSSKVHAP